MHMKSSKWQDQCKYCQFFFPKHEVELHERWCQDVPASKRNKLKRGEFPLAAMRREYEDWKRAQGIPLLTPIKDLIT